ncbi:hypothetical protein O181_001500 [Austropuccinia psidii MF-1]|uniref:Uncharacterized protein n=1 Tax=Austropuccinia psidii MF-1 TaxID=1389203 RepID=A0A9Q3GBW3_9BASI|nr:hypothetical protein [Austropuccinia psidii MF-1]
MKIVHTRNGRSYSVQPDGSGKARMKTRARSGRPSSRKAHLEDSRVAPHSPRSVKTTLDINSEDKLIQGNFLKVEPLPNGIHRNIAVPVQKLVHISQGRGVGNIYKPLAGGHELLLTHQELSGSGEYHRTLRRMKSLFLQGQGRKDKELVQEPESFIHRPEERVGNNLRFGEGRPSGIYELQASFRSVQR